MDYSIYAKPEFDWEQMREIRIGLEKGLDAFIYATPEIDWKTMSIVREELEKILIK